MENQFNTNQGLTPLSWLPSVQPSTNSVVSDTESVETSLENRRGNIAWHQNGKFAPGNPGGPGRPKTRLISEALKQALADGKADELKDTLLELTVTAKDSVKLAAIQEITDRTEGKAVQNVRHAGVFMILAPGEDVLNAAFGGSAPDESE